MSDNGSEFIERAQLLHGQKRYDLAMAEVSQFLAGNPDNAYAHSLLANCLLETGKPTEALREAEEGIRLGPEQPNSYAIYAIVLLRLQRARQAETAINTAIQLNPYDDDHFRILAYIRLELANWRGALEAADRGLALQSDNVGLINARGRALIKMGRADEALQTVDSALRFAPDSASSHANKGWSLLEAKDPKAALEHFREALRLDPTNDWARRGMVVGLKARYPLYRVVLAYYFWMSRLPKQARYAVIMGLWLVNNVLRNVGRTNPAVLPFILPFTILYGLFCYLTWASDALFNTLLRFNAFGKYLLTPAQVMTSNLVAGSFLAAAISFVVYVARQTDGWLTFTVGFLFFSALAAGTAHLRAKLPDGARSIAEIVVPVLCVGLIALAAFVSGL